MNLPLKNVCLGKCYWLYKRLKSISAQRKPGRHFRNKQKQEASNWILVGFSGLSHQEGNTAFHFNFIWNIQIIYGTIQMWNLVLTIWLLTALCFVPQNLLRNHAKAFVQNTENLKDTDRFLLLSIKFFLSGHKCFSYQHLHRHYCLASHGSVRWREHINRELFYSESVHLGPCENQGPVFFLPLYSAPSSASCGAECPRAPTAR